MDKTKILKYIQLFREKAEQHKLVIFVGAGVSCNVEGFPDWNGLIQNMANSIGYSKCFSCRHKTDTCEETCQFRSDYSTDEFLKIPQYVFNQDEKQYWEIFRDSIPDVTQDAPLSSAILEINPVHIITTNYDRLLESSTNEHCEQYQVIIHDKDLLNAPKGKYIIKMHGSLHDYSSIVLKEQDYLNYSQTHILIELFIKSLLTDHIILFLGYSLNDYNIKLIISWLNYMKAQNGALAEAQKVGYIVLDQEQIDETQRCYYDRNNIEVINIHEMPLLGEIPSSLHRDQGKRLYSFLNTIADPSLEVGFQFITDAVRFMATHTFIDYQNILKQLYIKNYTVLGWQLRLHSESDYLRLITFMESDSPEAAQLKQLFINTGIFWIECVHAYPPKSFPVGNLSQSTLIQNELFMLYFQNRYAELKDRLGTDSNAIEKYFFESIIDGYSNILTSYDTIDFSSLSIDQKIAYLHNQAATKGIKTRRFDSKKLEHFIQNIAYSKDRDMFSAYVDILEGNHKKISKMYDTLGKLTEDIQSSNKINIGSTSIAQIHNIKPLAMTQYFFYFFNHLFFNGFSDLYTFFRPYIEALICANSEMAERPSNWAGFTVRNEKCRIEYIDIDIITKFILTDDLYNLLNAHRIRKLNMDLDGISFLVGCFKNICVSVSNGKIYGYKFSCFTTLANLAILLNLVELNEEHRSELSDSIRELFGDEQATRIIFSLQCPERKSILKAFSTLCKSLTFATDIEIVQRIVGHEFFYDYAINSRLSDLRNLLLAFINEENIDKYQTDLKNLLDSAEKFPQKVILLRLLNSRITNQDMRDHYRALLTSEFLNLDIAAIYDFVFSGWITPPQETISAFLNGILTLQRSRIKGVHSYPDPLEANLECAYILHISGFLPDLNPLKELIPERPHLQFLISPETFDYAQVDFSDYMWVNFARYKTYMQYFIAHKEVILPRIRDRIEQGIVSEDEKKIMYGFLLEDEEIWKC